MTKRLVKIAKELNVGTSTIVQYLNDNGYEIENKPTAKVSEEMYQALLKEFQRSIDIKQKAENINIGYRIKKENADVETNVEIAEADPPASTSDQNTKEKKEEVPEKKQEEEITERPKVQGPKVLGKIDLSSRLSNRVKKEKLAEEPKAKEEPKVPEPAKAPEAKEAKVKDSPEEDKGAKTSSKEEEPATSTKKEPKEPSKTPKPEASKELNKPKSDAEKVEKGGKSGKDTQEEQSSPAVDAGAPKEQEDKLLRAETPELRGLKILGKIDTEKFDRPKKKKKEKTDRPSGGGNRPAGGSNRTGNKPQEGNQSKDDPKGGSTASQNDQNSEKRRRRKRKTVTVTTNRKGSGDGKVSGRDRKDRNRRSAKQDEIKEVSQKEIEDKIKATMARIQGTGKKKRQRLQRDKRERMRERQEQIEQEMETGKLELTEFISVQELAGLMDVDVTDVIMTCLNLGVIVSINQRLDAEIIELVAGEYGHEVEFISAEEQIEEDLEEEDDPKDLKPRAPIVTVMGHVDHGKTSLLDYIRSAKVAEGEAGGITQHIGAYEVEVGEEEEKRKITFLDTPGHEAFTAMRARGAKVTDIAIIIIAADDRIMPQTKEAISHAQAAGVPLVFAINKIDKAGAQPERIKQELAEMNLLVEEWGGQYQSQDISAKNGEGIDELLEKVLLEAEVLELKANPDRRATGTIVEASLDKGRGYVTKVLVQNGTLHIGDPIVAGEHSGKVRAMLNERGVREESAGPSTPVLILGLGGAPQAGERFKETESEQEARQIATKRSQIAREQTNRATKRISLDEIGRRLALGSFKELNLIVKGDVDGSVEALSDSLIKQSVESIQVNVIHKAVGQIIESDVLLATASDAIIIGFQVRPSMGARKLAEREGVEIKTYSVIYEAIDEIRAAMEGMLEPTKEEELRAELEVRDVFKISKVGTVAGCYVKDGKISRNNFVRLIREGIVVYPNKEGVQGKLASLKRFKDDVKEVKSGLECGLSIENFNDIKVGDTIEAYEIVEVKQTLD